MPFDWLEYLRLAQALALKGDEASKRTAISRAYYFVYHLANDRAVANCGARPQGIPTHAWCWERFINTPDAACNALGHAGDRLKRLRNVADYDGRDITRLDQVCERMLLDVTEFHADLSNLDTRFPAGPVARP